MNRYDQNTEKLTRFLNDMEDNIPLSIFLKISPITISEITYLKKINLSILINYRNNDNVFNFTIQYPSRLSIRDRGQVLKDDIFWLKSDDFNIECTVNQIIFSFPKLLIAKELFYDFFKTFKKSV